jgi:hypothetical protein
MVAIAIGVIEHVLRGFIGKFTWVYLNNINIYSVILADHIAHI